MIVDNGSAYGGTLPLLHTTRREYVVSDEAPPFTN